MNKQKNLLKIIQTWNIKPNPEYRGFRCADCQKYIHKAWHNYLDFGGYKTPVHFCNECQKKFGYGGKYHIFVCDKCHGNMFKAFHVWSKKEKVLEESHYCKNCWSLRTQGLALQG